MTGEPLYLAFETGGTKLVTAVAGPDARIVATKTLKRSANDRASTSFHRVVSAAQRLLSDRRFAGRELKCIGFGFGGTVRRSTNTPHLCLHEDGWDEVDVVGELKGQFGVPVVVENDCKLAALAEAHFGAAKGARSLFYITLGTGVGGGYVLEGRVIPFGDLGEAEIGHVVVDPGGPKCCCGNQGCVEAVCSGPGLVKLCHLLAGRSPNEWSRSSIPLASDRRALGSEQIIQCWLEGDAFATHVVRYSMRRLASAVACAINLLVPDRIVIGGGLGTSTPRLWDVLRAEVKPLVVPYFRDSYRILGSALGEGAVSQGAVILAVQAVP